jgi:hypothetical protein
LIEHSLYASAFGLLRSEFEAYVRGQWLMHCITESQADEFLKGKTPPRIDRILSVLEETPSFEEKYLSKIKSRVWDAMCAYTHAGGLHLQRWNTSVAVEPNYSAEELVEVLNFAEIFGALAVVGIAELASDDGLAHQVLSQVEERVKRDSPLSID